ncbi:hypothetical protein ACQZV8_13515 [Magnetococcales bacterium HHB-1]
MINNSRFLSLSIQPSKGKSLKSIEPSEGQVWLIPVPGDHGRCIVLPKEMGSALTDRSRMAHSLRECLGIYIGDPHDHSNRELAFVTRIQFIKTDIRRLIWNESDNLAAKEYIRHGWKKRLVQRPNVKAFGESHHKRKRDYTTMKWRKSATLKTRNILFEHRWTIA